MATATQEAPPRDGLLRLGQVVLKVINKWQSGELSPYKHRLEPKERWACFKELVDVRGTRYTACSLENFNVDTDEHRQIQELVLDFCDNMPRAIAGGAGLVFLGPPGTGKDHLMVAAMRTAIIDHGFSVKWADGLRLYSTIKSAIETNSTEKMLAEYVKPQILALSDPIPPRDALTAYELAVLRDIVERRYSKMLSTWVTTNVTDRKSGAELFSLPVLDRLLHGAIEVNMCGLESYRLR